MAEIKKIGRYIVEGTLGEGAMGCVFKAHDPNLDRIVAIKTMRTKSIQKKEDYAEFKERFFLECRTNGSLNHPNIVAVYDSGLMGKDPYLVMEYLQGKPLDEFIEAKGATRYKYYIKLLVQIAAGLDYAHEEGVLHRDIKPGNILVANQGDRQCAKLLDFGLAKLKDSKITQTGFFFGTPSYASPEQVLGAKLDLHSDLFSFGIVAYEMLTGTLPFEAHGLHAILYKIANEKPLLNFERLIDYVDVQALTNLFNTIFNKKPADRFQSAGHFVSELESLTHSLKDLSLDCWANMERAPKMDRTSSTPARALSSSRVEQVDEIRSLFKAAVLAKNLSSSRYCLDELGKLEVDTSDELNKLDSLKQALSDEKKQKSKELRIKHISSAHQAFRQAFKARNIESIRYCIGELARLKTDTSRYHLKLSQLEKLLEKKRLAAQSRQAFQDALENKDLDSCTHHLNELKQLHVSTIAEEQDLKSAQRLSKEDDANRLRSGMIRKLRKEFERSAELQNLESCRYYIREMAQLGVDVNKENELVAEHQRVLDAEKSLALNMILQVRKRFNTALELADLAGARQQLMMLTSLSTDSEQEQLALGKLESEIFRSEEEHKLKAKMADQFRSAFHEGYEKGNYDTCRYYFNELIQLDVDVSQEGGLLAKLNKP